jgi:cytochrome c biogenesis protein CcmG/thiol:disulfide interchange protein DsbE
MSIGRRGVLMAVLVGMAMAASPRDARAQEDKAATPGRPGAGTRVDPASVDRAKEAIARARKAYGALKSYSGNVHGRYVWKSEGNPEQKTTWEVGETFAAPRSFAATTARDAMLCDGKALYKLVKASKQYTQDEAPEALDPQRLTEGLPTGGWLISPALTIMVRGDRNPEFLLKAISTLKSAEPAERDGVKGTLLKAAAKVDPSDERSPLGDLEIFFRPDGLIASLVFDITEASKEREPDTGWEKVAWSYTYSDIVIDGKEPAAETFRPPAGFAKVDSLDETDGPGGGGDSQTAMIGKPAPEFDGKGLDDKPVKLADLKGRVVVLDFWATWCPPCVMSIPHIQAVSEKFAGKPVTVLGINQDQGDADKVSAFVKDKGLTFRHLMDDGEVGQRYGVTGIPCTVLIDKDGVVQDVTVGFDPAGEEKLSGNIEKLLAGKPLRSAEEIAAIKTKQRQEADRPAIAFEDSDADRLRPGARLGKTYYSRHMTWEMNIDDEPGNELVNPGEGGSLELLDSSGETVRTITLPGVGRSARIDSAAPVWLEGKRHWLVSVTRVTPDQGSELDIGLYTDEGKEVWAYTPTLPEGTFVQCCVAAGDLTGDGEPEMVAGLSAIRHGGASGLQFGAGNQAGSVIVLSKDGKRLSQRSVADGVDLLFVGKPKEKGKPANLLVASKGRLQRLTYAPETKP